MKRMMIIAILLVVLISSCSNQTITIVDRPDTTFTNDFYISNRAPLIPSSLIKLPVGSIQPQGWLLEYLERQKNGLTGHLGEISAWLQKEDNAWLAKDGQGKWGWEEVPYWLKGYGDIGYILQDKAMMKETQIWLDAVLENQREDGNFGPVHKFDDGTIDFWGNMIMLYCLQSYYDVSDDYRVIDLMTRYFKFQLSVPDEEFLTHYWQNIRGVDNLYSVYWLYNRTGEKFLLELAEKIHRNSADWTSRGNKIDKVRNWKAKREGMEWPEWYGDQIDWHNVNHAQCFKEPAVYYQLNHDERFLQAAYDNFHIIRKYFGQVPGGMFGSDENARPGYDDPRQGIETCGIVEQMNSDEHMMRITGDSFWMDHLEDVAYNTYPAAVMPDFSALHYFTSPNMVLCDKTNHHPGLMNSGPFLMMNPFSSRCCQHNHAQGWPYLAENLWMATPDNGVLAAFYCENKVNVKVGNGQNVLISEFTHYPFEEDINFEISTENTVEFPLYLRIPNWCENPNLRINGKDYQLAKSNGKYIRIDRNWNNCDVVSLQLPMKISVKKWTNNHNSVSVNYGPLTYSLKITEKYIRQDSEETAIYDSKWQSNAPKEKWPAYEIFPDSPWNYGLLLSNDITKDFKLVHSQWPDDNFPFIQQACPLKIIAKGKRIPQWQLDECLLCGELSDSPVNSNQPEEMIELVPMGACRLRISAFPEIADDNNGNDW